MYKAVSNQPLANNPVYNSLHLLGCKLDLRPLLTGLFSK